MEMEFNSQQEKLTFLYF